jgi:hypothetical protein
MALPILDGNQSATTLSSILTSGEHIPAHTVVSLGTQAITDIAGAVSGSVVSISNFPATQPVSIASVTIGNTVTIAGTVTANPTGTQTIAGTVTANISAVYAGEASFTQADNPMMAVGGLLQGFNEIRPITIDLNTGGQIVAGTVTANLSQIAFTNTEGGIASDDGGEEPNLGIQLGYYDGDYKTVKPSQPLPISGTVTVGNSVTIGSLPLIAGTVTANLANVVTLDSFWETEAIKVTGGNGYGIDIAGVDSAGNRAILNEGGGIPVYPRDDAGFKAPFPVAGTVTVGNSVTIASLPAISGTVTANASFASTTATYPSQIVAIGYKDEINTGNITPVTNDGDGGLPVFLGGISVEGNNNAILPTWLDGQEALNVPIAGTVTIGNSVTIASLPAISGTVTANLSISSTVITSGSFSSLSSATLVPANPARKMATVYNLGAGQLFVNAGVTATTLGGGFMVALSSGDFYECDYTTTTLSAIFATAGTASWMSH